MPNCKLVQFHSKPICTATLFMRYNCRRDIIVSATKVQLQYRVLLISQFSDNIVASPNTSW